MATEFYAFVDFIWVYSLTSASVYFTVNMHVNTLLHKSDPHKSLPTLFPRPLIDYIPHMFLKTTQKCSCNNVNRDFGFGVSESTIILMEENTSITDRLFLYLPLSHNEEIIQESYEET